MSELVERLCRAAREGRIAQEAETVLRIARLEEREECAKVAESGLLPCDIGGDLIVDRYSAETIAAAIRNRSAA